jgi:carbon-monoxide dehydrogenase medium subunit
VGRSHCASTCGKSERALLRPFRYVDPTTIVEASSELADLGDEAKVYAGGSEILLLMREGLLRPSYLVDVKGIADLRGIELDGDTVRIGATETHRRIQMDPLVRSRLPVLAEATRHIGNVRVRTQGTLGGNLCFADPHADPGTALLVHGATLTVASRRGTRRVDLEAFLKGMYEVDLAQDELLVDVRARPLPESWRQAYVRFEQFYRPTVTAAVAARVTGDRIDEVRLAVGSIGPKPLRLRALEARLAGSSIADAIRIVSGSGAYLAEQLEPVDDLLGPADFKVYLAAVYLTRALRQIADPRPTKEGDRAAP